MNSTSRGAGSVPNVVQALSDAQSILDAAEKRAAERLAEAEAAYEEAKQRGYDEGFVAAQADVAVDAIRLIEQSGSVAEALAKEAAELALAISATIIGEQVRLDSGLIQRIASRAIQNAVVAGRTIVAVHPDDRSTLIQNVEHLRRIAGGGEVVIEAEETMLRGSCIVRTDFGEVDSSVQSLIEAVALRLGLPAPQFASS